MSATMRVDDREFLETFRKLAALSGRELSEFANARMYHVLKGAYENTPVAERSKIQSDLGATIKSERLNKKGKIVRRYSYAPTPVVYAILNARRKKAGESPLPKADMKSAASKFIASRLRAVGSLRSGWKRALAIIGIAGKTGGASEGPPVKMSSKATAAQPGWSPKAEAEYRLAINKNGQKQIDPRVEAALASGFDREKNEMLSHLEKKMEETFKKAGAK